MSYDTCRLQFDSGIRYSQSRWCLFLLVVVSLFTLLHSDASVAQSENPNRLPVVVKDDRVRIVGLSNPWLKFGWQRPPLVSSDLKQLFGLQQDGSLVSVDRQKLTIAATFEFLRPFDWAVSKNHLAAYSLRSSPEGSHHHVQLFQRNGRSAGEWLQPQDTTAPEGYFWLSFSADGQQLMLTGDKQIKLFQVPTLDEISTIPTPRLNSAMLLPDASILDSEMQRWPAGSRPDDSPERLGDSPGDWVAHRYPWLVTQQRGTLFLMDLESLKREPLPGPSRFLSGAYESGEISADGTQMAAVSYQGSNAKLVVWDLEKRKVLSQVAIQRRLAVPHWNPANQLWLQHTNTGQLFPVAELSELETVVEQMQMSSTRFPGLALSASGDLLFENGRQGRVIHLETGQWQSLPTSLSRAAFHPKQPLLAGFNFSDRLQQTQLHWYQWESPTLDQPAKHQVSKVSQLDTGMSRSFFRRLLGSGFQPLPIPEQMDVALQFIDGGQTLCGCIVSQNEGPEIVTWETASRKETSRFPLKSIPQLAGIRPPLSAAFSQDGRQLILLVAAADHSDAKLYRIDLDQQEILTQQENPQLGHWAGQGDELQLSWQEGSDTILVQQRIANGHRGVLWNAESLLPTDTIEAPAGWMELPPNSETLVEVVDGSNATPPQSQFSSLPARSNRPVTNQRSKQNPAWEPGDVYGVKASDDAKTLVIQMQDGRFQVWRQ